MTQEVQVTLTLEVDVTQSKEDIIAFVKDLINTHTLHSSTYNRMTYDFHSEFTVKEEREVYNTYPESKTESNPNLFDTNFVITGTKEELLEVEKVLQANGIKDDVYWNERYRMDVDCLIIAVYRYENKRIRN